jgi:hypothetical protein
LASRRRRKLEEAGRRGLVVRWSEYPTWIALHDPLSGEWVEIRAEDCFPSLVDEANRRRKKTQEVRTRVAVKDNTIEGERT